MLGSSSRNSTSFIHNPTQYPWILLCWLQHTQDKQCLIQNASESCKKGVRIPWTISFSNLNPFHWGLFTVLRKAAESFWCWGTLRRKWSLFWFHFIKSLCFSFLISSPLLSEGKKKKNPLFPLTSGDKGAYIDQFCYLSCVRFGLILRFYTHKT